MDFQEGLGLCRNPRLSEYSPVFGSVNIVAIYGVWYPEHTSAFPASWPINVLGTTTVALIGRKFAPKAASTPSHPDSLLFYCYKNLRSAAAPAPPTLARSHCSGFWSCVVVSLHKILPCLRALMVPCFESPICHPRSQTCCLSFPRLPDAPWPLPSLPVCFLYCCPDLYILWVLLVLLVNLELSHV